jgi:hypothetical protein
MQTGPCQLSVAKTRPSWIGKSFPRCAEGKGGTRDETMESKEMLMDIVLKTEISTEESEREEIF